jgi:hypothetical protein
VWSSPRRWRACSGSLSRRAFGSGGWWLRPRSSWQPGVRRLLRQRRALRKPRPVDGTLRVETSVMPNGPRLRWCLLPIDGLPPHGLRFSPAGRPTRTGAGERQMPPPRAMTRRAPLGLRTKVDDGSWMPAQRPPRPVRDGRTASGEPPATAEDALQSSFGCHLRHIRSRSAIHEDNALEGRKPMGESGVQARRRGWTQRTRRWNKALRSMDSR